MKRAGMRPMVWIAGCVVALVAGCFLPGEILPPVMHDEAAVDGIAFLQAEVPRWQPENDCFSCHNNGDAARALYLWNRQLGRSVDDISATTAWLHRPADWEHNGGDEEFSDQRLMRVQFAAALVSADRAGLGDAGALAAAAAMLAADQLDSGAWQEARMLGSPITYGPFLATAMARRTLLHADPERYREQIAAADRWFRAATVQTVMDAAATLLALDGAADAEALAQQAHCLELIARGQAPDGGWGPYVNARPEVFDTALAVLALLRFHADPAVAARIEAGRGYLRAMQDPDGGWPETTRPSGNRSYAHRISTSGWAVQALLAPEGGSFRPRP